MADDTATSEEAQVTFTVKSSNDQKFVLTISTGSTVADLKAKLSTSEFADIPAERQRLIYSGRVLRDTDTLASTKIKDGNTVHLVKSAGSNARQNPANQGAASSTGGNSAGSTPQLPTNLAAGTGNNPLAGLTGARYAGFHGLPSASTFGPDGGMGPPANEEEILRLMDDPNFLSQMNEAMDNPAIIEMMTQNPMVRNNPMVAEMLRNPEMRRMMFNPEMMRMQLQMQRAMNRGGAGGSSFPAPGVTDTTPQQEGGNNANSNQPNTSTPPNPFGSLASMFPPPQNQNATGTDAGQGAGGQQSDPLREMTRNLMANPQALQSMMQMMGGAGGAGGAGANPFAAMGGAPNNPSEGGQEGNNNPPPNPFAALFGPGGMIGAGGGMGSPPPADNRPPEELYETQLRQLNEMGFYEFDRNVSALRRSGGNVQGAIEFLLSG